jgi:hypothetical protein
MPDNTELERPRDVAASGLTATQQPEDPAAAADARDGMPTPQEWQKLQAEWTHDADLRRLEEHAVRYEDQPGRPAADNAHRAQFQQRDDATGLDR